MKILITGGAGFIGSALIRYLITHTTHQVLNLDKLTYAANLTALESVATNPRYQFQQMDICDGQKLASIIQQYQPEGIIHLAAESHVDRSIAGADSFIQSNIVGTYQLLEATRYYWQTLSAVKKSQFRFHHISTDEVYGELATDTTAFTEQSPYCPSSPYSASKAAADHLVRAWHRTYALPILISHSSNNYGPYQHCEKLIPFMLKQALHGQKLPIYGTGLQIRDWLFVEDHIKALYLVFTQGKIGQSYNIGGNCEKTNLSVVQQICQRLNQYQQNGQLTAFRSHLQQISDFQQLITFVDDRAGHDFRYAINNQKMQQEFAWQPETDFTQGLEYCIDWYINYFTKQKNSTENW